MTLADYLETPDWMIHAACRGMPSDLFFPTVQGPADRRAHRICAGCAVRPECLDYAPLLFGSRRLRHLRRDQRPAAAEDAQEGGMNLRHDILLLAFRTAHYTDAKTPRAQSKEFKLLEEAVEYLATSIEELIDRRVQEAIDSLQANGYIPV